MRMEDVKPWMWARENALPANSGLFLRRLRRDETRWKAVLHAMPRRVRIVSFLRPTPRTRTRTGTGCLASLLFQASCHCE